MPGLGWGLASVLAGAGVRYFAPRLPAYFLSHYLREGHRVHNYWDDEAVTPGDLSPPSGGKGPTGAGSLLWYGYRMPVWTYAQALDELPRHLVSHRQRGYPFDADPFRVPGRRRRQCPARRAPEPHRPPVE